MIEIPLLWTLVFVLTASILSVIYARFFADESSGTWFFTAFLGTMGIIVSLLIIGISYVRFV